MNIMTKRSSSNNIITYEHICDTQADMSNINSDYITLGSICIVLNGADHNLEVYIANSDGTWQNIMQGDWVVNNSGLLASLAGEYDPEHNTYSKGDLCIHNKKLYMNKSGMTLNGEWDDSYWEETTVAQLIAAIPTDRAAAIALAPQTSENDKLGDLITSNTGGLGFITRKMTMPYGAPNAGETVLIAQGTSVANELSILRNLNPLGNILAPYQINENESSFLQQGIKIGVKRNSFYTVYNDTTTPSPINTLTNLISKDGSTHNTLNSDPNDSTWVPNVLEQDLITKPNIIRTNTLPHLYFWIYCPTDNLYIANNLILATKSSGGTITYSKISAQYADHNAGFYMAPLNTLSVSTDIIANNNMAVYFYLWHETLSSSHDPVYWGIGYSPIPFTT